MTMGEYWAAGQYDDGFFGSAAWYPDSDLPVWVVLIEGNSESTLPTSSPLTPTRYDYFVVVLNAHTGYVIGASPLTAPDELLADAQGLDPALYARYPLEAALEYTRDVTDFPVSEPGYLPGGFSLARVTLELAHPLQDVLPYPQERRQTVLQIYSDGQGSTLQLAQFRGELPNLIEDADLANVDETRAWASHEVAKPTWLAWTWVYPEAGAYVTSILYSAAPSISLHTLHEMAVSIPAGRPPPPTPEPVMAPTALPSATQTDGPGVTIALAVELAMESFGHPAPWFTPVEDAHDPVARLMRLSEDVALTGRSIPDIADPLVWVVEAEGTWSRTLIGPVGSGTTYRYASVAIDAQTGDSVASSRTHAPIPGPERGSALTTPTPRPRTQKSRDR